MECRACVLKQIERNTQSCYQKCVIVYSLTKVKKLVRLFRI